MILVDTSIWVNHLRAGSPRLVSFLQENLVLTHSYVIGELACGMLKNRSEILALLQALSKGSGKNNFTEFALRFRADWVDLREHNRKRRQAYVEDCASEDRPKMA